MDFVKTLALLIGIRPICLCMSSLTEVLVPDVLMLMLYYEVLRIVSDDPEKDLLSTFQRLILEHLLNLDHH